MYLCSFFHFSSIASKDLDISLQQNNFEFSPILLSSYTKTFSLSTFSYNYLILFHGLLFVLF